MKIKIAIANTLKPVDDVRAFEKIAQSITKTNKYQVNIIGNIGKKESNHPDIRFCTHFISRRSIFRRIKIRFDILLTLFKLNPSIIIIQTHELLIAAIIHKLIRGSKLIYDVREDYKKNIRYISSLPGMIKIPLSQLVRIKEWLCVPLIDKFWLAEKCYVDEIGFPIKRTLVIDNKATVADRSRNSSHTLRCLFSGTISTYGGVQYALEVFQPIHKLKPQSTLTIIGQCHDSRLWETLEASAKTSKSLHLNLSKDPIPHAEIIEQILRSDLGLIAYQPNSVNQNKIPTKLYEYSRYGLPYLIQRHNPWVQKAKQLGGSIPINFHAPDLSYIFDQLENSDNLFHPKYPEHETWEFNERLIYISLNTLI